METSNQTEVTSKGSGPSGGCVLTVASAGVVLACLWHIPNRFPWDWEPLVELGVWALGMLVVLEFAATSVGRGPAEGRGAAVTAMVLCLLGIGWVVIKFALVILQGVYPSSSGRYGNLC